MEIFIKIILKGQVSLHLLLYSKEEFILFFKKVTLSFLTLNKKIRIELLD